ncbi:MAG: rhodanese-like domain-containing protein [Lachnospiraceae bacterium]|nr:rhodanese-like domain-containing protein [Lachnospiraceae bacterium]
MKTIAASRLFQYLREHPQAILVDLRSPQAYKKGHVRGAQNIPYEILEENLSHFSSRQVLVFYCQRGGSAMAASRRLGEMGWDTTAVVGGYEDISRLTETVSGDKI